MALIKNQIACMAIQETGRRLAEVFNELSLLSKIGMTTEALDKIVRVLLAKSNLVSQALGYKGFPAACCLSLNDEIVHGIPKSSVVISEGDLLKIDICVSYKGYCADMARSYSIGNDTHNVLIERGEESLKAGISNCLVGNYMGDLGHAIQTVIEKYNYSVVTSFCGHGIGKHMHEEPEVPNWGAPRTGMKLRHGMVLAIEPMLTVGSEKLFIDKDKWTARTCDGSLAIHIEDTVIITENGPIIATQLH